MSEHEGCRWCGGNRHPGERCPEVKAFEYDADGKVRRVEFITAIDRSPPPAPHPATAPARR